MFLAARPAALARAAASTTVVGQRRCVAAAAAVSAAVGPAPSPSPRPPVPAPSNKHHRKRPLASGARPAATAAAAAAAAAAGATANASLPAVAAACALAAPYALAASAGLVLASAAALALLPRAWAVTQGVARTRWPLVALALAYAVLLAASWEPDTLSLMMPGSLSEGLSAGKFAPQFFPTLEGVSRLFARPFAAASFLVHVAAVNLVAARAVFWDASARRVPAAHSILLCAVLGPVGVLAHEITKATGARTRAGGAGEAVEVRAAGEGGGSITLLPYSEE